MSALEQDLEAARHRLATVDPALAGEDVDVPPHEVARWLDDAARAVAERDFVIADDDEPHSLYLWMNEFVLNADRWFLVPFAMGPLRPPRSAFQLVARSLPLASEVRLRVAMSHSEEGRVCVWETPAADPVVHVVDA